MPLCRAFTLIEMMIMLAIIVALMAISYAVFGSTLGESKRRTAEMMMYGIETGLPKTTIQVQVDASGAMVASGGMSQIRRFGDIDEDGILDATPRADGAPASLTYAPEEYLGFVRGTGFAAPGWAVDPRSQQLRDPWGFPIRIRFTATGPVIWSVGPDGIAGTADDVPAKK